MTIRHWQKSSFSSTNSECVELAALPDGGVAVRDTKDDGHGPVLRFTSDEWVAFRQGMAAGEFADLG